MGKAIKSKYSIGISRMDEQHAVLVGLINALKQDVEKHESAFIQKVLFTLREYTQTHFAAEEKMLAKMDYPNLEDHIKLHQQFIEKIDEFSERLKKISARNHPMFAEEVSTFLNKWLLKHILVDDKAYSTWLTE